MALSWRDASRRLSQEANSIVQRVTKLIDDTREARRHGGIGPARIARDLIVLNLTHWLGVRAYFQYRLFDPSLTLQEKSEYLPDSRWATERLWSLLTPRRYRLPFDNKLIFNRVFGGAGLPVPSLLGVYDPEVGETVDGRPLRTADDLRSWLRTAPADGFVFKPVWGIGGSQVLVFTGSAPDSSETAVTLAGDRFDAERLVQISRTPPKVESSAAVRSQTYLLEQRIVPHPRLVELAGPTLSCVRVVTLIGLDGVPAILGAVYKIQPEPLGIDHLSHGAIGSWVDLERGTLGAGRSRHHFGYTAVIPGTDRGFIGFQLPHWAEVKKIAVQAATVMPWARAIGWDIGISERGPILIEGNAEWSTALLQIPAPRGLMTGELKRLYDTLAAARTTRRWGRRPGRTSSVAKPAAGP